MGIEHSELNGQQLNLSADALAANSVDSAEIVANAVRTQELSTVANTNSTVVSLGDTNATQQKFVFVAPAACTVTRIGFVVDTTVTSDATGSHWSIQVRDMVGGTLVVDFANDGTGTPLTANVVTDAPALTNTALSADDVLELQLTKAGSGADLKELTVVVDYTLDSE